MLADDPAFYDIKAMFAWWMLRDTVGGDTLGRAIRAYNPAQDKDALAMQRLIEAQAKRDLAWFFNDWVYRDRGLPDLTIQTAFTRPLLATDSATPAFSATVTVGNLGETAAEVPLVIHTEKGDVSARVLVKGKSTAVQRMTVPGQPTSATVNDGSVPEANVSNNTYTFTKTE